LACDGVLLWRAFWCSPVGTDGYWGLTTTTVDGQIRLLRVVFTRPSWLPNPELWEINSIGEVTHDGQRMLIAVLSDDNASEDSGISPVEAAAKAAASAMTAS
jgi:hypothetical protein